MRAPNVPNHMEAKFKHLEFIQSAIARMATNSFLFKGWAITIAVGLSAFGTANTRPSLLAIAVISTAMFWGLDGYYLWLERGFIRLFAEVAAKSNVDIEFSMAIDKTHAVKRWLKILFRPHLVGFYGAIIAIDIIGIFIVASR